MQILTIFTMNFLLMLKRSFSLSVISAYLLFFFFFIFPQVNLLQVSKAVHSLRILATNVDVLMYIGFVVYYDFIVSLHGFLKMIFHVELMKHI